MPILNNKNIQGLPIAERVNYGFVRATTLGYFFFKFIYKKIGVNKYILYRGAITLVLLLG